jgi:hypothetical protein
MTAREYSVYTHVNVIVKCRDDKAITRCVENWDENEVPQPDVRGGSGWRNMLYDLRDESDVIEHWVSNAVRNGVEDASRLDGWADLPVGTVTMLVDYVDLDGFSTEDLDEALDG